MDIPVVQIWEHVDAAQRNIFSKSTGTYEMIIQIELGKPKKDVQSNRA